MIKKSRIQEISLEGSPKERGIMHGKLLKEMIKESILRTRYYFMKSYHASHKALIEEVMRNSDFISAVRKWTPQLLEELEGIVEGADVDFDELFFLQCLDESGWIFKKLRDKSTDNCSAFGCFQEADIPTLVAQTLDWNNINEGLEVIFRIKYPDSSLECLIPSIPGVIGLCGINNTPLGITTNALWRRLNSSLEGLPVSFIIRGVLEQNSLEKAIEFIKKIQHASGENYIIGDSHKVVDFECSENKICQFLLSENPRRIYHTNHPLINDDYLLPLEKPRPLETSWDRLEYLEYRLKNPSNTVSLETAKHILRSHFGPICVHQNHQPGDGYSLYAVIYALKERSELHITAGPPCLSEFEIYTF